MTLIRKPNSLSRQMILYLTIAMISSSFLISLYYYYNSVKSLKNNMISNANTNMDYIMSNIDGQVKLAVRLSDYFFMNNVLDDILTNSATDDNNYKLSILNNKQIFDNFILNSSLGNKISVILIEGKNGIELRFGENADLVDKELLQKQPWFTNGLNKNGEIQINGIFRLPNNYIGSDYIIPIVRPILDSKSQNKIGWCFLAFKENLISDVFREFNINKQDYLYIIDLDGNCISANQKEYIGKNIMNEGYIKQVLSSDKKGHFDFKIGESNKLVVFYKSSLTGWSIVNTISYTPLNQQKRVFLRVSIFIFLVGMLITFAFTMFLSSHFIKPIKRILDRMKYISEGNFECDYTLEGEDEIGKLGKGINNMSCSISSLLNKVKEEESQKRKLELKVLQNQVNPHFLYNTLNSIKWMATVQKADGIRDIVSALGRLLMNMSKGTSEEISIREEIALTNDYILIQNIRYNGKIKVDYIIENEELLDFKIIKFSLQPIVENAIFHGIEPKKDAGNIKISIKEENEGLLLSIEDDGVGISDEQIKKIYNKNESKRGLSGIGIRNVEERIKLFYGSDYGLEIESIIDVYTKVIMRIPKNNL